MKTFDKISAQGDVCFIRREALPVGVKPIEPINGQIIVTHSETGHNHVMLMDRTTNAEPAAVMYGTDDPLVAWLQVNRPTALDHLRPHDTHESIMFEPGIYEVRRQREYDPMAKIARRVDD